MMIWRAPATVRSTPPAALCLMSRIRRSAPCIRCKDCDGFPCLVHAKSDAEVLAVRPALQCANLTGFFTRAKAVKLNTDPSGKAVTQVEVERDGGKGIL